MNLTKAIIIAVSIGGRLGEIWKNTPKCLIEIAGKTLLERQIEILNSSGIQSKDILVVIGSQGEVWTGENHEKVRRIHPNIVINNENVDKNQSYSLWLALQEIDDSVICVDGDTIFDGVIIKTLMGRPEKSILPFRKARENDTRRKIVTIGERVIKIEKGADSDKIYTPIIKLDRALVKGLKQELGTRKYFNETLEIALNKICDKFEINVLALEPLARPDMPLILNINTPEEYELAQKVFAERTNI